MRGCVCGIDRQNHHLFQSPSVTQARDHLTIYFIFYIPRALRIRFVFGELINVWPIRSGHDGVLCVERIASAVTAHIKNSVNRNVVEVICSK